MNEAHAGALDAGPSADMAGAVAQDRAGVRSRRFMAAPAPDATTALRAKRIFDIVGALCLLTLSIPLLLCIGVVMSANDGPILYRDKRYGRNGTVFECLKIRTMH